MVMWRDLVEGVVVKRQRGVYQRVVALKEKEGEELGG